MVLSRRGVLAVGHGLVKQLEVDEEIILPGPYRASNGGLPVRRHLKQFASALSARMRDRNCLPKRSP